MRGCMTITTDSFECSLIIPLTAAPYHSVEMLYNLKYTLSLALRRLMPLLNIFLVHIPLSPLLLCTCHIRHSHNRKEASLTSFSPTVKYSYHPSLLVIDFLFLLDTSSIPLPCKRI